MKIDFIKILIPIGLILGTIEAISSFRTLNRNLDTVGTEQEWRFYFSLAGFTIFSSMLFSLLLVLIIRWVILKGRAAKLG